MNRSRRNSRPKHRDFLSINDLDELPSGMATVVTVTRDDGGVIMKARITDSGLLKTIATDSKYLLYDEWEITGCE